MDKSDTRTWDQLSAEERRRVIAWLRQDTCGEQVEPELRRAAASALEGPLWGQEGDTW